MPFRQTLTLRPSEIRFTQDSVKNSFTRNDDNFGKPIGETLDELCEGVCKVGDIAIMEVFYKDGSWWSADNRRLWVFREFERLGGCDKIDVREINMNRFDERKFTTENSGREVRVRGRYGNPGGRWHRKPDKALTVKVNQKTRYYSDRGGQLPETRQGYGYKIHGVSAGRDTINQIHKPGLHVDRPALVSDTGNRGFGKYEGLHGRDYQQNITTTYTGENPVMTDSNIRTFGLNQPTAGSRSLGAAISSQPTAPSYAPTDRQDFSRPPSVSRRTTDSSYTDQGPAISPAKKGHANPESHEAMTTPSRRPVIPGVAYAGNNTYRGAQSSPRRGAESPTEDRSKNCCKIC